MPDTAPRPTRITLHKRSKVLDVAFDDGEVYALPAEYLRVFSPSAEVRGHGAKTDLPKILVTGKAQVGIEAVEPVGNYAVRLVFDDGHDSGIFGWTLLRDLGERQDELMAAYRERLGQAGQAPSAPGEPKVYRP